MKTSLVNWYPDRWNERVTPRNAFLKTTTGGTVQSALRLRAREAGRSLPKQNTAAETGLEASCADDMPEVYKIPMVRMSE